MLPKLCRANLTHRTRFALGKYAGTTGHGGFHARAALARECSAGLSTPAVEDNWMSQLHGRNVDVSENESVNCSEKMDHGLRSGRVEALSRGC